MNRKTILTDRPLEKAIAEPLKEGKINRENETSHR
jgi:hypothetical protein